MRRRDFVKKLTGGLAAVAGAAGIAKIVEVGTTEVPGSEAEKAAMARLLSSMNFNEPIGADEFVRNDCKITWDEFFTNGNQTTLMPTPSLIDPAGTRRKS